MANQPMHVFLWANLCAATRGLPLPYPALQNEGGSVNYKLMAASRSAQVEGDWKPLLALLAAQRKYGHLSLGGPHGVATEAGAPDPHYPFNALSVIAAWRAARLSGPPHAAIACAQWVGADLALARAFLAPDGRCILPAPRVKDEKGQEPVSSLRDVLLALVERRQPSGPAGNPSSPWWHQDYALAAVVLRDILRGPKGEGARQRLLAAPFPKLYLPIHRADLGDGGYVAWLEDTAAARDAAIDVCNSVEVPAEGEPRYGYDWSPPPAVPSQSREEILGLAI